MPGCVPLAVDDAPAGPDGIPASSRNDRRDADVAAPRPVSRPDRCGAGGDADVAGRAAMGDTRPVTDAPRPVAAALSGGPRPALAALLIVVVAVVAACNQSSVSPAPTATAGTSSAPIASARPAVTPTPDPGTAAMKAFVALVTSDGFDYQATFSGDDRHTTDILPIRDGVLQVSGKDVLVRATFTLQSHRYVVEHRYVGGKAWIRYDTSDPWQRLTFPAADSMAAFAAVRTISDLAYLGPVSSGGKTFYKVSFRSAIVNPIMVPAQNLTEQVVTSPKLTLLIDGAGRPIRGTAEIDGRGRVSGQLQEIVIDLTVTFTKVGAAVTIKAP